MAFHSKEAICKFVPCALVIAANMPEQSQQPVDLSVGAVREPKRRFSYLQRHISVRRIAHVVCRSVPYASVVATNCQKTCSR